MSDTHVDAQQVIDRLMQEIAQLTLRAVVAETALATARQPTE